MQDTFDVSFVVNDSNSGMVDNNRNRDFALPLINPPTEDQVSESRTERFRSWEKRIHKVILVQLCVLSALSSVTHILLVKYQC